MNKRQSWPLLNSAHKRNTMSRASWGQRRLISDLLQQVLRNIRRENQTNTSQLEGGNRQESLNWLVKGNTGALTAEWCCQQMEVDRKAILLQLQEENLL